MKKLILSLVVAMALIGAVYGAAATLTFGGVDNLGSGTEVIAVGANVNDAQWVIDGADNSKVNGIKLAFDAALASGTTINVQVRSTDCTGPIEASTAVNLGSTLNASTLTAELVFVTVVDPAASIIDCLEVTVIQPIT